MSFRIWLDVNPYTDERRLIVNAADQIEAVLDLEFFFQGISRYIARVERAS